jgi:uncharacterized protein YraI
VAALGTLLATATVVGAAATAASAHTPTVTVWCTYEVVTQSTALNVRSHHSTTSSIVNSLARGSRVLAGQNGTATGSGYTWRQVYPSGPDGWAAAQYLRQVSGSCLS